MIDKKLLLLAGVWGAIALGIYALSKNTNAANSMPPSSTTTPASTSSTTSSTTSTTTSTTTTPSTTSTTLGTSANPLIFDNGYSIPAYYKFSTTEFENILSANSNGITTGISTNPAYIGSSYYYYDITQWVNYTAPSSTTSSTTITNVASTTSSAHGTITISPMTINRTPNTGQIITIDGFNFTPNSTGYVSGGNIEISGFTANENGNFTINVQNTSTSNSVSGLYNAIYDSGSTMNVAAFDYGSDKYSNTIIVNIES